VVGGYNLTIDMTCYHPLTANRLKDGRIVFRPAVKDEILITELKLPCGRCVGCLDRRAQEWSVRCMHEASLWSRNCVITLTYDDAHLPSYGALHYKHFQLFFKRLRKKFSGFDQVDGDFPIRFYMCGEYGSKLGRPHYHACIFNFDFLEKTFFFKSPSGALIYRSAALELLWPFGHSSVGELTHGSASYIARYVGKKQFGTFAEDYYVKLNPMTGELVDIPPEYNKMSLKPGIGRLWYDRFKSEVYPVDQVIIKGRPCKPPRYYDKLFKSEDASAFDAVAISRIRRAQLRASESTPERLAVRETVHKARLNQLPRSLK